VTIKTSEEPIPPPPQFKIAIVLFVGLPFVCVLGLALHGLFYAAGYRYQPGHLPIPSLIAIVIGTRALISFRDMWSNPSKKVWYAALLAWTVLALAFWARLTQRLPSDL